VIGRGNLLVLPCLTDSRSSNSEVEYTMVHDTYSLELRRIINY